MGNEAVREQNGEADARHTTDQTQDRADLGANLNDELAKSATDPFFHIATVLGQAYMQCALSGMRFGHKATQRLVEGQMRISKQMENPTASEHSREQALRTVVDEARGCLSDLAEASSDEFRELQSQLAKLQEAAPGVIDSADDSSNAYVRRWKVKR